MSAAASRRGSVTASIAKIALAASMVIIFPQCPGDDRGVAESVDDWGLIPLLETIGDNVCEEF